MNLKPTKWKIITGVLISSLIVLFGFLTTYTNDSNVSY